MKFEKWKELKSTLFPKEVSFRGMNGCQMTNGAYQSSIYYPTSFLEKVNQLFSSFTISDVYYEVSTQPGLTKESIYLLINIEGKSVSAAIILYMEPEFIDWNFQPHWIQKEWEKTYDVQTILFNLFVEMEEFLLDNSPNRLHILTTSLDDSVPDWIRIMKKNRRGERHES